MEQELKRIAPLSVLVRSALVFAVIGVIVGAIMFFLPINPDLTGLGVGKRLLSFVVFVPVYTVTVSLSMTIMALLYNFWAAKIGGIKITLASSDK